MAIETQSSPESVVTSISRPKSARTPPSAFPFLQIQLSKSKIQKSPTTTRPAADRRFFPRRRDPHRHDRLGTARVSRVECPARAARPCSPPTRLFKQHTDPSVNTLATPIRITCVLSTATRNGPILLGITKPMARITVVARRDSGVRNSIRATSAARDNQCATYARAD